MIDQAFQLRKLVSKTFADLQHSLATPPVLLITSGKKGVGVSTIAQKISETFVIRGLRPVLIKANLEQPIKEKKEFYSATIVEVLNGQRRLKESLVTDFSGVRFLPGRELNCGNIEANPKGLERFYKELCSLHRSADLIVIDAGSQYSPWAERLWEIASLVSLVTTPDDESLMKTYAMMKSASQSTSPIPLQLVINQSVSTTHSEAVGRRLAATSLRFLKREIKERIMIPFDQKRHTKIRQARYERSSKFYQPVVSDVHESLNLWAAQLSTTLALLASKGKITE